MCSRTALPVARLDHALRRIGKGGGRDEERNLAALPIVEDHACACVQIRLALLEETAALVGELGEEIDVVGPALDAVGADHVDGLDARQHLRYVLHRVLDVLHAHDALEDGVGGRVAGVVDDTRTVDEEDAAEQGDVLPNLGLPGNRSDFADFLGAEGVDDGALAHVGVAHKAHGNVLLVLVEACELAKEVDEGALAERVRD
mmetsp:Transcript_5080/g.8734  ORF Transcript_5080/g.8734 Transcript_5080/m.8734 type:complete len:202 (-) Transcript_5080:901-1506(-)